jgi:hypothetical protein
MMRRFLASMETFVRLVVVARGQKLTRAHAPPQLLRQIKMQFRPAKAPSG